MQDNLSISRRTFLGASTAIVGGMPLAKASASARVGRKIVLLAGRPSHGPMEHEFNAGTLLLKKCLENVPELEVDFHKNGWPKSEKAFEGAGGIFLFADGGGGHPFIQSGRLAMLADFMKRGVGLMCAHFAVEVPKDKIGRAHV